MPISTHFKIISGLDAQFLTNAGVTAFGAVLDREECRKTVVCYACAVVRKLFPATQVGVLLADHYVPLDVKSWDKYTVAKRAFVNENNERCEEVYHCSFEMGQWDD